MKQTIMALCLSLMLSPAFANEAISPKLTHLIKALVASQTERGVDGEPLGKDAEAILLKIAQEGIHDPANAALLEQVEQGSWLLYVALLAEVHTPAAFCLHDDVVCREAVAADEIPLGQGDEGRTEAEQEALFQKRWAALGFDKVRFGP
ncbi:hypothetical protein AB8Q18_10290 [Neisseriaceae bacterium CLB008]